MQPEGSTGYFQSYANLRVHELMLRDGPRNRAYHQAIKDNQSQIKGRTVLDLGTGTGILAIFCAKAGASKVYAVDASDIYKVAIDIIEENQLSHIIEVIHSKIEELELPEKVDVIISEWMGFYLFHEGMLDSLIYARDNFLKPGGLIFPESATLYSAPCSVPSLFDDWNNAYDVSMTTFGAKLRSEFADKPQTMKVGQENILTDAEVVTWIDLRDVTYDDIKSIKLQQFTVANKEGKYQGICLWFTCTFPSYSTEPVILSTEPKEDETHWKQTVIVLPVEYEIEAGAPIVYELVLNRDDSVAGGKSRRYNIVVEMLDAESIEHPEYCNCYMTKCILVKAMLDKYDKTD